MFIVLGIGSTLTTPKASIISRPSEKFHSLADIPVINNVTSPLQFVRNLDYIELFVYCDTANYSVFANFSLIDTYFVPGQVKVLDFNNGTYRINYTITVVNNKTDGLYIIPINATNITSSQSAIYNNFSLTLDNTLPSLAQIISPGEKANKTGVFDIQANASDQLAGVSSVQFWDGSPGSGALLETDYTLPYLYTWNTSSTIEGPHALYVRVYDQAGNANTSIPINITVDNTIPNIKNINIGKLTPTFFVVNGNANGTFSAIKSFQYNLFQLSLLVDPTGYLYHEFSLAGSLPEGNNPLIITVNDSVDLTHQYNYSLVVDTTGPVYDAITQTPLSPEYDENVTITIFNATDALTGIKNITLYYSINKWANWTSIDISSNYSAIIPIFPYATEVVYDIVLYDNYENIRVSSSYSYTVNDTRPPIMGQVQQRPQNPTHLTPINLSITYVNDIGSGIADILLNYSLNGGSDWNLLDITTKGWAVIQAQPAGATIYYEIIVIDTAGNLNKSVLTSFTVQFDPTNLIIILVSIGVVTSLSIYSVRIFYSRKKHHKLELQFLNEREALEKYFDMRLADVEIILSDINFTEGKLDNILQFEWVPKQLKPSPDDNIRYQTLKEFTGLTQFASEIKNIETDFNTKVSEITKKYNVINPLDRLSTSITSLRKKVDAAKVSLDTINDTFSKKYSIYLEEFKTPLKVEFPLGELDKVLARNINKFKQKYEKFAKEIDHLLIERKVKVIENSISELEALFVETDEWIKNAEEWSRVLPLPKDRGYKFLLKTKKEQYLSIKNEFNMKIEKFRAELISSINFAQNFIKWNYDTLQKRLKKLESMIYEDVLRYISSEDAEILNIDAFIEEKFSYFSALLVSDRKKIEEFYESHKEFSIQDLYDEWNAFATEMPSKLEALRDQLNAFVQPIYRLFRLVKGSSSNFYSSSIMEIEKFKKSDTLPTEANKKITPLNVLFSKTVWKINRIDNEIKDWIDLLPFDLETQQLMILLREWNATKEKVYEKLNTLSKEQRVYKCEIMHEILDPLNDEIWECSNCGAIACTEHLEKWYHRKAAPECFKCGNTSTFKLKILTD